MNPPTLTLTQPMTTIATQMQTRFHHAGLGRLNSASTEARRGRSEGRLSGMDGESGRKSGELNEVGEEERERGGEEVGSGW